MSMTAGAAPVWNADKADGSDSVRSLLPSGNAPEVPSVSSADVGAEIILRRVRAVIEELKRQGPPPVGCMEG
jgi:hypothetical protein